MFKKLSFFLFLIFVLTILLFAFFRFLFPLIQPKKGNLSVTTPFQTASVYLDNEKLGQTPVDSKNLRVGDHTLKIESEGKVWETKTTLTTNTFNRVVLNLSKVDSFTSGENLFFRPNQSGLTILSKPEGAKVFVNGEEKGETPLKLNQSEGILTLTLKKDGYLSRELTPNVVKNFGLVVNFFLSADPFGTSKKLDSNSKLTLFSLFNPHINLAKDYSNWVEGVRFTQKQFSGTQTRFDLLIDPSGATYVIDETEWKNKLETKAVANIGYLVNQENGTLTEKASAEWVKLKSQFN